MGSESEDESDNFSDIDDAEVASYLHNDEEQRYKKIIWEKLNREYLEEQAAKEAEAAAKEAMMAKFEKGSAQALDAKNLVEEAAANYAKLKKGRQRKRAAEAKNPETAAEAAHQTLSKKRNSSRLNLDRFKELFDDPVIPDNLKKSRSDPNSEETGVSWTSKSEAEGENNEEELDTFDESEEGNGYGDDQDDSYHYDEEEYEAYDDDGLF